MSSFDMNALLDFFKSESFNYALTEHLKQSALVDLKQATVETSAKSESKPKSKTPLPKGAVKTTIQTENTLETMTIVFQGRSFELTKASKNSKNMCQYTYKRGTNSGGECGTVANYKLNGVWYHGTCEKGDSDEWKVSSHLKSALTAVVKDFTAPKKKSSSNKTSSKTISKATADERTMSLIEAVKANEGVKTMRKHKQWKVYWDPDSKIAFDAGTSHAIGSLDELTGKIEPLSETQVHECEARMWLFDRANVQKEKKEVHEEDDVEEVHDEVAEVHEDDAEEVHEDEVEEVQEDDAEEEFEEEEFEEES